MRLRDKVAIITGGANGIGRAFCLRLSHEGAKVVIADIDEKNALNTAQEIEIQGGEALVVKTDVSSPESTREMARKAVERFQCIDILVNNAAIYMRPALTLGPFYEIDPAEWDRVMAVNLKGPFLCASAVCAYMREQAGGGKIINIASDIFHLGHIDFPMMAHYVASKGGVIGLTRAMARELGQYHINVNSIAPGSTYSENHSDERLAVREKVIPMRSIKRVQVPEDLTGALVFLASSDSDFMTGQTLLVDGGHAMI